MNWLARLEVDAQTAHDEGIRDNYGWHKRLWDCFPAEPDAKRDFLTRIDPIEGSFRLWILSKRKPERPQWCPADNFTIKEISSSFLTHRYYAFDLRANPVETVVQRGPNGETLYPEIRETGAIGKTGRTSGMAYTERQPTVQRKGQGFAGRFSNCRR